ncbi:hypothetical protein ACHAXT_012344 [Thalassiosira profunda]
MPRKAAAFPRRRRAHGSRRIVGSPWDSDSEISFSGGRKAGVMRLSFRDKIVNNAFELQELGLKLADRAIDTMFPSDAEDSDDGNDIADLSRIGRARKRATKLILDEAGRCAASLQKVADDVPAAYNPCLGLCRGEDDFSSSAEKRRPRRRKARRKKKVSEAKPHNGSLSDSISVSSDAYSTPSYDNGSESESTTESVKNARLSQLRRRRQQFLRRRALERAAGADTDDEDEASVRFGGPGLGLEREIPSQELRKPVLRSAFVDSTKEPQKAAAVPELVNTSNEESTLSTTNEEDSPKGLSRAEGAVEWQYIERVVPELSSNLGISFLGNHHLGSVVVRAPNESLRDAGLQLGDVIIRLNQRDVSGMDAAVVSDAIEGMAGECASITFLRKMMSL